MVCPGVWMTFGIAFSQPPDGERLDRAAEHRGSGSDGVALDDCLCVPLVHHGLASVFAHYCGRAADVVYVHVGEN
jgi:hypothetical protein